MIFKRSNKNWEELFVYDKIETMKELKPQVKSAFFG